MTPEERFWAKVVKGEGCWLWMGTRDRFGYGHGWFRGQYRTAQRISYLVNKGPIPDGYQVDHLCRNPQCVRPDHLEAVTPRTNTLRSTSPAAQRAKKTHCQQGHEYNAANTYRDRRNRRYCKTCQSIRKRSPAYKAVASERSRQRWAQTPKHPRVLITHCLRGHELTGDNVRYRKPYGRSCRACERMRYMAKLAG